MLASVLAAGAAGSVMAAPLASLGEYRAIDRWVEIFHPEELVGPPVDPQLRLNHKLLAEPDPDPWRGHRIVAEPEPDPWKGTDLHPEEIGKQLEIGF